MTYVSLTFTDAPRAVLDAVLIACSQNRDNVATNLAAGQAWAPQVNISGSHGAHALYRIDTPRFSAESAARIAAFAAKAES